MKKARQTRVPCPTENCPGILSYVSGKYSNCSTCHNVYKGTRKGYEKVQAPEEKPQTARFGFTAGNQGEQGRDPTSLALDELCCSNLYDPFIRSVSSHGLIRGKMRFAL